MSREMSEVTFIAYEPGKHLRRRSGAYGLMPIERKLVECASARAAMRQRGADN